MAANPSPTKAGRRGISQKTAVAKLDAIEAKQERLELKESKQWIIEQMEAHPELLSKIKACVRTLLATDGQATSSDPEIARGVRSVGTTVDWLQVKCLCKICGCTESTLSNVQGGADTIRMLWVFAMGGDVEYKVRPLKMPLSQFLSWAEERHAQCQCSLEEVNFASGVVDWTTKVGFWCLTFDHSFNNKDDTDHPVAAIIHRPTNIEIPLPGSLVILPGEVGSKWMLQSNHIQEETTLACPTQFVSINLWSYCAQKLDHGPWVPQCPASSGTVAAAGKRPASVAITMKGVANPRAMKSMKVEPVTPVRANSGVGSLCGSPTASPSTPASVGSAAGAVGSGPVLASDSSSAEAGVLTGKAPALVAPPVAPGTPPGAELQGEVEVPPAPAS